MSDNRTSLRLNHRAEINIIFSSGETLKAHTRNMSDGGLLIECPYHPELKAGELIEIIVIGIEGAVPRPVKIIRADPSEGGIGVQFIEA